VKWVEKLGAIEGDAIYLRKQRTGG